MVDYQWQDPRIEFIALDYLSPVSELIEQTKDVCKDVTHAFFTSYVHVDDFKVLKEKNVPLFTNFLDSLDAVAPNLENVCLQTGGKVCTKVSLEFSICTDSCHSIMEFTWDP
tara:strand:- start:1497 stop:1832 length:336 start_codon:yes stop_codon:yes gene_type:complete